MKILETVREDGLRIITVALPHQRKVYVELSSRVGSAYDPVGKQGLFHFFEHMAFKGTKRRSIEQIQSFSKRNLIMLNASTGLLATSYYGVAVYTKLEHICDLLCDIYLNSIFSVKELNKERRPVLLEIARNKDDDNFIADEALRKVLWKQNPFRRSGAGSVKGVHAVRQADFLREKKRWHVPAATVALAIGKVNHASFVKEITTRIPIRHTPVHYMSWSDEYTEVPEKQRIVIHKPGRQKAIVLFGFKLPAVLSEKLDICLSTCLTQLLVSGTGSRLWNEVREKRGLAYAVGGGVENVSGLGRYFTAYIETSPEHVPEVERLLLRALRTPLTEKKAFEEIREHALDRLRIGFDDNFNLYEDLIWEKILENQPIKGITRIFSHGRSILNALSLKELEEVRKQFFLPERFVTVIVKP